MLQTVSGNDAAINALKAALESGRLSHSVLLCGEQGTGTGYAARCLAADYLYPNDATAAAQVMRGHAPACLEVEGEGASGEIKIDTIRKVRSEIFHTALTAEKRVVIIYQAQNFNLPSANALLKVLEEPPEGVLFILTASSAAAVLATIRSRCIAFSFAPVSVQECAAYLVQQRKGCRNAAFLAQVFGGKIGTALACVDDPLRKAALDEALRMAQLCAARDAYSLLVMLSQKEKDKPAAKLLLGDLQCICAAVLRGASELSLSPRLAAAILPLAQTASHRLSANVNTKLVFADLAAHLRTL